MDEFNEKAVKKIVDAVDGDIAGLIDKLKATVALGKDYDKMCIRDSNSYRRNRNTVTRKSL